MSHAILISFGCNIGKTQELEERERHTGKFKTLTDVTSPKTFIWIKLTIGNL